MGDGLAVDRLTPFAIPGLSGVAALSGGVFHTLALMTDGTVRAWGDGYSGQLGDGRTTPSPPSVQAAGLAGATAVAAGAFFSMARTGEGSVWVWGGNSNGELGDGTTTSRAAPVKLAGLPVIMSIAAAGYHGFAVAGDGRVYAWGTNEYGELGDGVRPLRSAPARVPGAASVTRVAAGGTHTLALKSDGTVLAWGSNAFGQLGDGTQASRSTAGAVSDLTTVREIGTGYFHSMALKADGTLWSWGYNYQGILGLGDQDQRTVPTRVPGLPAIASFAVGSGHTLALGTDGSVWAFGTNGNGQLGDGTTTDRFSPVRIAGLANVTALAGGGGHSLALRSDGTVWSWGLNYSGELGDGTETSRTRPGPVPGLTDVVAIAAGDSFSFALKRDGTLVAWGANWSGQLGDGTGLSKGVPTVVPGLAGLVAVSGGGTGAMALARDGTVYSWGDNIDGRLGDGTFVTRNAPVVVLAEDGRGAIETNDWFLDLDPAAASAVPLEKTPGFLLVASNAAQGVVADLRFRAQDVGTNGSVFVFALAPEDAVAKAKDGSEPLRIGRAKSASGKDLAIACVVAQLNGNGQLQAVSLAGLQAAVTGLLSSAGSTVAVIPPGASTASIAGATFFIGYGLSSSTMINTGLNRGVVSVPGSKVCAPQPPQTGWWWNPQESGRGFAIEVQGRHLFYAAFLYDETGRATWTIASGNTSLDGSLFAGDLLAFSGGQTLAGPYKAPAPARAIGTILLTFTNALTGTMIWPGGAVPIQRFDFNNLAAPPQANVPESGWWWNANESGRGYFIEWQNGFADLAGFMYDDAGNPVWYLVLNPTPDARTLAGSWTRYAGGQTITGAYRPATLVDPNVAPVTIRFDSTVSGTMTLPGGNTIPITRFRF